MLPKKVICFKQLTLYISEYILSSYQQIVNLTYNDISTTYNDITVVDETNADCTLAQHCLYSYCRN